MDFEPTQSIRKISKASITYLVLCIVTVSASAQDTHLCRSKGGLLSRDRPSVYITYETANGPGPINTRLATSGNNVAKLEGEQNELSQEQRSVIWLRLHNNTRWAINFPTESLYLGESITPMRLCDGRPALGLRSGIKVTARYEVDRVTGSLDRVDVFSRSWLPAGGSILFSVPREHIIEPLGIYLPFNYEWEYGERTFSTAGPQHRAYFRASDLPKQLQLQRSAVPQRQSLQAIGTVVAYDQLLSLTNIISAPQSEVLLVHVAKRIKGQEAGSYIKVVYIHGPNEPSLPQKMFDGKSKWWFGLKREEGCDISFAEMNAASLSTNEGEVSLPRLKFTIGSEGLAENIILPCYMLKAGNVQERGN